MPHRLGFTATVAAWAVVVGSAGCDGDFGGRSPTATTQHVLRVQATDAGSGTVVAPDALPQIACTITAGALSGVCAIAYPSNSAVALVATPNGGSTFSGWSGACTGTGQCVVDMSQERTVNASFTPTTAAASRTPWTSRSDTKYSRTRITSTAVASGPWQH